MTQVANPNVATQEFVFKGVNSGTSKKSGQPFHMIELHDPVTLDNVSFFIRPENPVNTTGIGFKDKVRAEIGMQIMYGKLQPTLFGLKKVN